MNNNHYNLKITHTILNFKILATQRIIISLNLKKLFLLGIPDSKAFETRDNQGSF